MFFNVFCFAYARPTPKLTPLYAGAYATAYRCLKFVVFAYARTTPKLTPLYAGAYAENLMLESAYAKGYAELTPLYAGGCSTC